jgi:hypothetical protein
LQSGGNLAGSAQDPDANRIADDDGDSETNAENAQQVAFGTRRTA